MAVDDRRTACWREFCTAAEASAAGRHALAEALVARHPVVAGELRAFIRAIRDGRVRRLSPYVYEPVR